MPFLGKQPTAGFASIVKDDLTPNGSTTAFTLSKQVANANDIAVFLGNVRQEPTDAYTVSGTTLTMSEAPASGLNFYVLHIAGTTESSVVPADNTISTAKIQSSAVTDAKIASGITSSKVFPNGIRAGDLDVTTQGNGLSGWEHIETRVCKSDGDTNFSADGGSIKFDVSAVKHLYSTYKLYFHIGWTGSNNTYNLLFDTLQGDGSTPHGTTTWYGANVRHTNTAGNAAGAARNGGTTMKFINNVWATGSSNSIGTGGCQGEITCYGFHWEVTGNIDGEDMAEVTGAGAQDIYRTYYQNWAATYDDAAGTYASEQGGFRQNQSFIPESTSGANSFGGFSIIASTIGRTFARGSYASIYGLRVPTAD